MAPRPLSLPLTQLFNFNVDAKGAMPTSWVSMFLDTYAMKIDSNSCNDQKKASSKNTITITTFEKKRTNEKNGKTSRKITGDHNHNDKNKRAKTN